MNTWVSDMGNVTVSVPLYVHLKITILVTLITWSRQLTEMMYFGWSCLSDLTCIWILPSLECFAPSWVRMRDMYWICFQRAFTRFFNLYWMISFCNGSVKIENLWWLEVVLEGNWGCYIVYLVIPVSLFCFLSFIVKFKLMIFPQSITCLKTRWGFFSFFGRKSFSSPLSDWLIWIFLFKLPFTGFTLFFLPLIRNI